MGLLVGFLILIPLIIIVALRFYIRRTETCPVRDRLDGKTVVITGATSGIGREVAIECASRGAKLVLGCRNAAKAEAVTALIKRKTGNEDVHFLVVDLASLSSVKEFADSLSTQYHLIDVLVNNAAYMGPKMTTQDGYDRCFQVNFLSHFCLTNLLIRRRVQHVKSLSGTGHSTPRLRVVNVCSQSYARGQRKLDEIISDRPPAARYDIYRTYSATKLAMMLFTTEVNFRHSVDGIICLAVHPGAVKSGLMANWPGVTGKVLRLMASVLFRSPNQGAQSVIYCVTVSEKDAVDQLCGKLVVDCRPVDVEPPARAYKDAERLWALGVELSGLNVDLTTSQQHG